jgi:hypothetical protein
MAKSANETTLESDSLLTPPNSGCPVAEWLSTNWVKCETQESKTTKPATRKAKYRSTGTFNVGVALLRDHWVHLARGVRTS